MGPAVERPAGLVERRNTGLTRVSSHPSVVVGCPWEDYPFFFTFFSKFFSKGHLEKLPFRPISASQKNEKCSHVTNMLRFLISLFLGVYAYLISNENSNFSRHPKE